MVIGSDNERDPEYVLPGTSTPSQDARAATATPKQVASGVATVSQFDEERTLTSTFSESATNEQGASGSLGVSWLEEASGSVEVPEPATAAQSASSDEADSSKSIHGSSTRDLTQLSTSPIGGVSTGSIKFIQTQSF